MYLSWRVINWLAYRPTFSEWPRLFVGMLALKVAWVSIILSLVAIVMKIRGEQFYFPGMPLLLQIYLWAHGLLYVVGVVLKAVASEEATYRLLPFCIAFTIVRLGADEIYVITATVIVSSFRFGILHAFNFPDPGVFELTMAIVIQGVSGIFFAAAFLKASGLRLRYALHGYAASIALHSIWNAGALSIGYFTSRL